jgi:HEAT repeat protein
MRQAGAPVSSSLRKWRPKALWTAAILLALGLVWIFVAWVLPVWHTKRVVEGRFQSPFNSDEKAINALGGPDRASEALSLYCCMPSLIAPDKKEAIFLLTYCGAKATPVLQELLKDSDPWIRLDTIFAIVCSWKRTPEKLPNELRNDAASALLLLARDANPTIRHEAVGQMASRALRSSQYVPALLNMLDDNGQAWPRTSSHPESVRWEVIFVLGWNGYNPETVVLALEARLRDADIRMRRKVVWALGRFGPTARTAAPVLTEFLADRDEEVRFRAAEALSQIDPGIPGLVPVLTAKLASEQEWDRRDACRALGQIGAGALAAVPELQNALKDSNLLVRLAASKALGQVDPENQAGLPGLMETLDDANWGRRADACEALGQMGARAKSAIPLLEKRLQDEDEEVRSFAAEALKKIRGEKTE